MERTKHKIYGRSSNPTLYYLLGNGGKLRMYWLHIKFLTWIGFRVMAFEYDPKVLNGGEPNRLTEAANEIERAIKADMSGREIAGIYGVSLGSYLGVNMMARLGIKRAIFNTGPGDMIEVIWGKPGYKSTQKKYQANGFNRQAVEEIWAPLSIARTASRLKGSKILCQNSWADTVLTPENVGQTVALLEKNGVGVQQIVSWVGDHAEAIVRQMFRPRIIKRFFSGWYD